MKYRSQAPLVDSLLADIGLNSGDLNSLTNVLQEQAGETRNTQEPQSIESE